MANYNSLRLTLNLIITEHLGSFLGLIAGLFLIVLGLYFPLAEFYLQRQGETAIATIEDKNFLSRISFTTADGHTITTLVTVDKYKDVKDKIPILYHREIPTIAVALDCDVSCPGNNCNLGGLILAFFGIVIAVKSGMKLSFSCSDYDESHV